MLRAVARTLDLDVDGEPANEILVRAAVIWVRFPVLVDELLDADQPPVTDPMDPACPPKWRRRDVQQVLTMRDGTRMIVEDLALYYGTFFAPPIASPPTKPADPVAVVLLTGQGTVVSPEIGANGSGDGTPGTKGTPADFTSR